VIGHFSCHGAYDPLRPLDSRLALRTPLTLRMLLEAERAPWLTNLSACETGIPDLQAVEQSLSFPTAFLLAGASHVLATLWPVGNAAATTVNRAVYTLVNRGAHPAEALRAAVLQLRGARRGDAGRAFRWAAFAHYGSPW
jgi:CHAT domain-containing protein